MNWYRRPHWVKHGSMKTNEWWIWSKTWPMKNYRNFNHDWTEINLPNNFSGLNLAGFIRGLANTRLDVPIVVICLWCLDTQLKWKSLRVCLVRWLGEIYEKEWMRKGTPFLVCAIRWTMWRFHNLIKTFKTNGNLWNNVVKSMEFSKTLEFVWNSVPQLWEHDIHHWPYFHIHTIAWPDRNKHIHCQPLPLAPFRANIDWSRQNHSRPHTCHKTSARYIVYVGQVATPAPEIAKVATVATDDHTLVRNSNVKLRIRTFFIRKKRTFTWTM